MSSAPRLHPGPNPTTSIYNASVVNFYNFKGSIARFENKNSLFYFEKSSSLLRLQRLAPGEFFLNFVRHIFQKTIEILMPQSVRTKLAVAKFYCCIQSCKNFNAG
jgi:hypothetical protein